MYFRKVLTIYIVIGSIQKLSNVFVFSSFFYKIVWTISSVDDGKNCSSEMSFLFGKNQYYI